jgi:serine/threonine protein kinase
VRCGEILPKVQTSTLREVDPPSAQLVERLTSLGLCTAGDLRRCRQRVRRLARDIPTFDTVWIDALAQNRALTSFQASMLGSAQPDALAVGPFVLVDRLGSDGRFAYYRARRRDDRRPVLLTIIDQDPETAGTALERLRMLVEGMQGCRDRGVAPIQEFFEHDHRLVVAGPWVAGCHLQELMVRRGRFPVDVVWALVRQIASGLAALERSGIPHGDLRLRNIRLTPAGDVVLVRPGLLAALLPEISIHSQLPADAYDTLAPERIGSGRPATAQSDLYALGCVLWQLLTGRPPWPHGNTLAKLAAHQSKRIPDVRTWSPDTPEPLANLVMRLTDPDPARRPDCATAIAGLCRGSLRRSRRQLARFLAAFAVPAGPHHPAETKTRSRTGWIVAGSAALLLLSVCLVHAGARTELLHIAQRLSNRLQIQANGDSHSDGPSSHDSVPQTSGLQPLPRPDAEGVIELDGSQVYEAAEIAAVGALTIRCGGAEQAVIVVRDRPLRFWAERVVLDNVLVRSEAAGGGTSAPTAGGAALLVIDAQELAMRRCAFLSADETPRAAIVWSALDPESAAPQRLLARESVFHGPGDAVRIEAAVTSLELENVLKTGRGALLELQGPALESPRSLIASARQVTLRGADGFVQCALNEDQLSLRPLEFTLQDCVFDITPADGAFLQFDAAALPQDWPLQIRIGGEGSVLSPECIVAAHHADPEGAMIPLDTGQVAIEGLQFAQFSFAGPDDATPDNSLAEGEFGYRRSSRPPGIDPAALPRAPADPYNSAQANPTTERPQQATR